MDAGTKSYPNRGITGKLRERFEKAPGVVLFATELAEEFKVDIRLIQQTVANIRREYGGQPLVHMTARAWVYQPGAKTPAKVGRVFEELATTRTGDLIIQDEKGTLYRATEL